MFVGSARPRARELSFSSEALADSLSCLEPAAGSANQILGIVDNRVKAGSNLRIWVSSLISRMAMFTSVEKLTDRDVFSLISRDLDCSYCLS